MSIKDLALEEAALKALADTIGDRMKVVKAELQTQLVSAGVSRVDALLPDGTKVGTISRPESKPKAVVLDDKAYLAWVVQNAPDNIVSQVVTQVRPAYTTALLAEMTAAGVAQWTDEATGEVHDVPGVEVKKVRETTHSVRSADGSRDVIVEAWRAGALKHLRLLELVAGGAE